MMLIYHVLPSYMLEYEKYEQFWKFGVGGGVVWHLPIILYKTSTEFII